MGRTFPHNIRSTKVNQKNHLEVKIMSEEIIKNNPAPTSYPNADGGFAAGGIGGVDSPAFAFLGNTATAEFGETSGPNAVNPSFTESPNYPGAGILRPDQARRFIDYVWDATTLANDGRRVTMRANTMELEKVNVGERVVRAANQGDASFTNAGATFSKVELTTKKLRLDWEVSAEALEDNIEGGALEDHIVRLMTTAFGNDIEDLAINGDTDSADAFLGIMDGFNKKIAADGFGNEAVVSAGSNWTVEDMQKLILALPRRYRAIQSGLKFYAGSDTFANIVKNNGTVFDSIGSTEAARGSYLGGIDQTFGNARQTRVLGIPVLEVPYYPADYVDLTFPQNRIWGFQRDITVNRFYVPKKDTIEYTVFVRFGINWEEQDAVAWAAKPAS
jgi:HK97 family phage major capsid protein